MAGFFNWLFDAPQAYEGKSTGNVVQRDEAYIDSMIAQEDALGYVSVVHACINVISQGLALPPLYVQQMQPKGRRYAIEHPLHRVLAVKPNLTQTPYELRETMGRNAALRGNAYAWINRSRAGEILEVVPLRNDEVSKIDPVAIGAAPTFVVSGKPKLASEIWHFKGPAADRLNGIDTQTIAGKSILLAQVAESFGTDLFKNRAALEGILSMTGPVDQQQLDRIRTMFESRNTGEGKRGRTAFFPADVKYTPLSATATDSQWLETRRYQIEEICRFFRVSPTKVFSTLGSQSYASVEQAHIAHDQDTDAHWIARFQQSATLNLVSSKDLIEGYSVTIDNRDYLRGTAMERAAYYNAGITGGWLTRNEAREAEGYTRSDDPTADQLTPAANLFGEQPSGGSE